ncbi:MAG TPA: thermonuclease family protein [Thermoanaerobaculia bacterium]|nr:thermonuclease family protein [Thermoanaerobaculia bacterium]
MPKKLVVHALFICLALCARSSFAGDSSYGRVVEVRSADVVLMDFGKSRYVVRLAGVVAPKEGPLVAEGRQFVERLVRDRGARMRIEGRNKKGEMIARVLLDDPQTTVRDLGVEIVLAGLARAEATTAYKYRELQIAEERAKRERRGLWVGTQP